MKKIIITDKVIQNHFKKLKSKLGKLEKDLKELQENLEKALKIKVDDILKYVITAPPEELYKIGQWSLNYKIKVKENNKEKEINKFSYMINKYDNFASKKGEYDAYDLAKSLNVNTCPYCNINSIYTVIEEKIGEEIVRPEFDHFFDKATYPILSLSIYNLIPSCHQCNSNLKGKTSFNLDEYIHPYVDDLDKEMKFSLKLIDSKFYHSIDGFKIKFENVNNSIKVENHLKVFEIKERYKYLKDIVLELIQKKYMYNESYLDELLRKYEGTFFKNKEDLLRLVSGGYISEDEINKRPLSKLIKDIMEEIY